MEIRSVGGVRLAGVAACVPTGRVANDPKVAAATGIPARRVAADGTSGLDLCLAAARRVLADTGSRPEAFGAILAVSFTQPRMPSLAAQAQARLGFPKDVLAFDVLQACAGWGYGLYLAALLVRETGKKVLLLDGDRQSAFLDANDPATAPLLSDGGTACVVEREIERSNNRGTCKTPQGPGTAAASEMPPYQGAGVGAHLRCARRELCKGMEEREPGTGDGELGSGDGEWRFAFRTDGEKGGALTLAEGGAIRMDGFGVFRFVATDVVAFLKAFMDGCGRIGDAPLPSGNPRSSTQGQPTADSRQGTVDGGQPTTGPQPSTLNPQPSTLNSQPSTLFFVPHQPNVYMVRQLAKAVGLEDRALVSADRFGNLASASVPATLAAHAETLLAASEPPRILFAGFGGGLAISAGLIGLPRDCKLSVLTFGDGEGGGA